MAASVCLRPCRRCWGGDVTKLLRSVRPRLLNICSLQLEKVTSRAASSKIPIPAFVDFFQLQACGGGGGQGLPKHGGFGGDGGNVIVMASSKVKTLKQVWQKYPNQYCKAEKGENSNKFHLLGKNGKNLMIYVPHGVLVHKANGEVVDLNLEGEHCHIAKGGMGGNDKTNFMGLRGESNLTGLELKLLADVGLVGFPNAGKSTFLRAISKAKPKVADLPFTTLSPQLGIMQFEDDRRISVADLPGLIEGAHQNYGMGFKFLRHAERTKLLLYVIDVNPFQLSEKYPERSAFEILLLLFKELEEYGHGMLDKPSLLALNKIDTDVDGRKVSQLLDLINNLPASLDVVEEKLRPTSLPTIDQVLTMSAKNRQNTDAVMDAIRHIMDIHAERRLHEELEEKERLTKLQQLAEEEHLQTKLV